MPRYTKIAASTTFALIVLASVGDGHALAMPEVRTGARNAVPACVTPQHLMTFLRSRNPDLDPRYQAIARTYQIIGSAYGMRWDYAFFQMMVETNSLRFTRDGGQPSDVRPEQFNFAGLGAVGDGSPGESFPSLTVGVEAHLQHILMYAGVPLANPVAERTRKVLAWGVLDGWREGIRRPITFRDVAQRWSPLNANYVPAIEGLAERFGAAYCGGPLHVGSEGQVERGALASAWVARSGAESDRAELAVLARDAASGIVPPAPTPAEPAHGRQVSAIARSKQRRSSRTPPRSAVVTPPTQRTAPVRKVRKPRQAALPPESAPPSRKVQTPSETSPETSKPSPDDALREMVSGRLVHLRSDMGAVVPVKFRKNGSMIGSAGNLGFFLGASKDSGKWWVKDAMLCKKWRIWFDGRTTCLKLKKRGKIVHWVSRDGRSGTAKIVR